jgi:mRNA interferase RelE/StbE
MRYRVEIEPSPRRALAKLPHQTATRIIRHLEALSADPRGMGAVKLSGHNAYRIRVGDYRVIYAILDDRMLVLVVDVGHRRDIYRGW